MVIVAEYAWNETIKNFEIILPYNVLGLTQKGNLNVLMFTFNFIRI